MQKNTKEVISALVTLNYKIITSKYFLSVETLWYQRKHVSPAFLYVHRRMNFFFGEGESVFKLAYKLEKLCGETFK